MLRRSSGAPARPAVRLLLQSGIYSLGNLAVKAAGLVLLPLYLDPARLPVADYGYLGLIETTAALAIALAGLGLAPGLLRYAAGASSEGGASAADYAGTAFLTTLATAALVAALVVLLAEPLAGVLLDDPARAGVMRWAGAYIGLKTVGALPYVLLRVRERAGLFLIALVAEAAVLVGGVGVALGVRDAGLEGVMGAFAASAAVPAVLLSAAVLRSARWRWRPALARQLLTFGVPLTGSVLASTLLKVGDRFVLDALVGPEVLAVYVLAARFGGLINMLFVQSFNAAFSVLGVKTLTRGEDAAGENEASGFHSRVFRHFAVGAGWGVLAVSVLALDLTVLLSPDPAYRAAEPLILPIALGFLAYGVYFILMNLLFVAERTRQIASAVVMAAVLNLALNLALVPALGAMGAALATVASYASLVGLTLVQARRATTVRLPWAALAAAVLLVLGLWALAQPTWDWAQGPRVLARLGLVGLYPPLVVAAGVYRRDELRAALAMVRRGRN